MIVTNMIIFQMHPYTTYLFSLLPKITPYSAPQNTQAKLS